jgi:ubiquinone biosynthesis protein
MADGASPDRGPQRFAARLARMGPQFVKIGQYLALRPDILPQAYCDELLRLVDKAPPVAWDKIHAILTTELGAPPETVFASIRKRPLAAGSIAQVHLAKTHDGRLVAVKVQRPDLQAQIARSLRWSRVVARALEFTEFGKGLAPNDVVDEIERWLRQELDFRQELENQQALRAGARHPWLHVPEPLPSLSTARVLTAEYLQGVPFSELIAQRRAGDEATLGRRGFDREQLAEHLITAVLHQVFAAGRFHADPHPGNLIAMPGDVVGLLDCGLTDILTPPLRTAQAQYLAALYAHDAEGMHRALAGVLDFGPGSDPAAFRRDFVAETNDFLARNLDVPGAASTSGYMIVLIRLARRHRVRLPKALLSMYRALLTVEAVARQLGAQADLASVGRVFFAGAPVEQLLSALEPDALVGWLLKVSDVARAAPGQIQELLTDLAEGRFVLSTQNRQSHDDRRLANGRARLVTLAVLSLGPAILLAGAPGPTLTTVLCATLAGLYAWMALTWWRLK